MDYRLYLLDPAGRVSTSVNLDAASDAQAEAVVAALEWRHGKELWQRARQVRTWVTPGEAPESVS